MATTKLTIILVTSSFLNFTVANRTATEQLYTHLLQNYNPYIRPNSNQYQQTVVETTLHLLSVNGLDELSGTLSTVVYIDMSWTDDRMVWNKTDYSNTWQILFPQDLVWKPDLVVTNPVRKVRKIGFEDIMIRYKDDGAAEWYTGDYLETSCDIDVTHFPFDRQVCTIEMIPWNYRQRELQVIISKNEVNLDNYTENGEWILYNTAAERYGDGPFEYMYFKLYMERRSSFFIINLFIPVVMLVFLNCMVFLLSADSGERIGYAITCLLSITVYLTLVSDTIPKTSKPLSVLSFILMLLLILSTIICFLTIIGLRFHFRKAEKPLPGWLSKVTKALRCRRCRKGCRTLLKKSDCRGRRIGSAENRQVDLNLESKTRRMSQQVDYKKPMVSLVGDSVKGGPEVYRQSFRADNESGVIYEDYEDGGLPEYELESWKTFAKLFDKICFIACLGTILVLGAIYFMISSGRLAV
ncbi:neuronal acetylcholine receptor subunit alpha-6-like [Saccostrea cucullata]|uniref:neuronal acetylcholine receptor subunit alpha-6-like n=1 Tax=Saccostrea cuccullata TaxID=36930 RepID=UPI002ED3C33E